MKKVLHLIWRIDGGGIEQFCINILQNVDLHEFIFDFAVCGQKCGGEEIDILQNSNIYHLPLIQGRKGKKLYLRELRKLLKEHKYDAVHSHLAFMNISTLKIAKECGVPIRISHTHVAGNADTLSLKNKVKRYLMNRYATKCFAVSHETAEYYYGIDSEKLSILYSGVDLSRYKMTGTKNPKQFIIVARICPEKNPHFVLDVAECLHQMDSELVFSWCGGGMELSTLQQKAAKRKLPVSFHGGVNNVEDFLRDSSYMLMPSAKEGFGMAAVEAQLSGVMVFASCFVPKDTDLGLIEYYPLDSAQAWADRIMKVIQAKVNVAERLKTDLIEKYDIKTITEIVLASYKRF